MNELESVFTDIANAIRTKTKVSIAFKPSEMANEVMNIFQGNVVQPLAYQSSTISEYSGNETMILEGAFSECVSLTKVSFLNCNYIGACAFASCSTLSEVSFPNCTYIGDSAFFSCSALSEAFFPKCSYIEGNAFAYCTNLSKASFPKCSFIGGYAFNQCSNLSSLYLLSTSIVTLKFGAFSGCSSTTIYVPKNLYNDYLTATGWSSISSQLASI